MNAYSWITLGIAAVCSTPIFVRPYFAYRAMQTVDAATNSLRAEMDRRGLFEDDEARVLHDNLVMLTSLLPFIASGRIRVPEKIGEPSPQMVEMFTNDFFWAMPYIGTAVTHLCIAEFIGTPWNPKKWVPALFSKILLLRYLAEDAGVQFSYVRERGVKSYERVTSATEAGRLAHC